MISLPYPRAHHDLRVVVADDYPDSAESLAAILQLLLPCDVEVCHNGGEAVRCSLARRPDVVILDLNMPVMGGLEAARWIASAYPAPPPLMLVITGNPSALGGVPANESPFKRAFIKPVNPALVAQVLKEECLPPLS